MIVVALILVWLRMHWNAAAQRQVDAHNNLAEAIASLNQLQSLGVVPPGGEANAAQGRSVWYSDGLSHAQDALDKSDTSDSAVRAQALIVQGDLNFALADMPDLPGATTQPSLRPDISKTDLLANAQAAYSQVLSDYPNDSYALAAARFGLAAVAEDLANAGSTPDPSQWDTARQQYQAVIDDPNAPSAYKVYANARLSMLSDLQQRLAIGVPPPGAKPTTR
jgi:hypothetical protein